MSAKVNEVLRLIEVRRSNLAFLQEDGPIKLGQNVVAKRQEMHDRMMYHGSLLVAADAASAAAGKDFKVSGEEVHPQEGLKKKDEGEKHHAAAATAAANSAVDTLSKEMEPAMITKTKESIETDSVFDASTTSFFKGYGIAAGHVEDRIGGLGLIGQLVFI
ncbi:hypothetical protein BD770DRAFT_470813 [Pilaira anomala]|nr:hypothetical protein BD770DRAFT_470813 [Pilaira anomala]